MKTHYAASILEKLRETKHGVEAVQFRVIGLREQNSPGKCADTPEPQSHVDIMQDRFRSIDAVIYEVHEMLGALIKASGAKPLHLNAPKERACQ